MLVAMRASNFSFLSAHDPQLARLGTLAERYFHDDAPAALIKLRQLAEFLAKEVAGVRGGVYYEAGFAAGLGIPVIHMVRAADVERLHFDTRQINHIVWTDPADLRQKLVSRIGATLSPQN